MFVRISVLLTGLLTAVGIGISLTDGGVAAGIFSTDSALLVSVFGVFIADAGSGLLSATPQELRLAAMMVSKRKDCFIFMRIV